MKNKVETIKTSYIKSSCCNLNGPTLLVEFGLKIKKTKVKKTPRKKYTRL